jgi:hypothetical protein
MERTYIQEAHKSIVNGRVMDNQVVNAMYDGNKMNVDMYKNGQHYLAKLDKKDIESILGMSAHPLALDKRLMRDFGVKGKNKSKSKGYKHKTNKSKTNKRNTNKHKTNKRKTIHKQK